MTTLEPTAPTDLELFTDHEDQRAVWAADVDGVTPTGPHFCLGANLARRGIGVMFAEPFRWLPDLRATTEPDHPQSSFIHGIERMRCGFTPVTVDPLED